MTALDRDLTRGDLEVLEFERARWKYQGAREGVIRERFGTSLTRHIQRVLALIEHPQAEAYDAHLVNTLRTRNQAHWSQRREQALKLQADD